MLNLNPQMARDQIGQFGWLGRLGYGTKRFFGDIFLNLGIPFKFLGDRARQRLNRGHVTWHFGQIFCRRLKIFVVFDETGDAHPRNAFNQHFNGAIGQFQQLQHIGQHAGFINAVFVRVIHTGVNLTGQQDLLVVVHHLFECRHRFFTPDKKRHNHMWEDHDVAQRQNGVGRA